MAEMTSPDVRSSSTASVTTEYFASPPEPVFNETQHSIAPELLQDSLELLLQKNESAVNSKGSILGPEAYFKDRNTVLFLFELCRQLCLTPDVQYRAAELFHRFMIAHIDELYAHVLNSKKTESPIAWSDVENRLKHQVILRAVSCIQLASKLSSHYHLVTLNRARAFLSKCGFRYAPSSIVQSEVRALKTVKFRVHHPTPLEFVEALLGVLGRQDRSIPVKQLHGISLKILDLFYLSRQHIYTKLVNIITEREDPDDILDGVQVNFMLLAAAVVTTASIVIYQTVDTKLVTSSLSQTAQVSSRHCTDFAWLLMCEVFRENSDMLESM